MHKYVCIAFDAQATTEPGQSYRATPMALASLDPLFLAALAVAHQDEPRLSSTCLRCHMPVGWLSGRSEPGDGSQLIDEDLGGVTCDVCHRMIEPSGGTHISDGQYTISQSLDKRGSRGNAPITGGHGVVHSDYTRSSELCGVCHSLFNPLEMAHDDQGQVLPHNYYEQRTYEEWADSSFQTRGRSCVDCHMERTMGMSCRERVNEYSDLAVHGIVGGNTFVQVTLEFSVEDGKPKISLVGLQSNVDITDIIDQRQPLVPFNEHLAALNLEDF